MKISYEYPVSGAYNETMAIFEDGRKATVNTQYSCVLPIGTHKSDCDQVNKMGGRCNCGLLDGIDVISVVADARVNGKRGQAPVAASAQKRVEPSKNVCPKCGTYCCGDCEAK